MDRGENTGVVSMVVVVVVAKVVVVVGVHTAFDIDPCEPLNMSNWFAFERTHAFPQSFRLNDIAPSNIEFMYVTLDTSHFEMSQLNDVADWNIQLISFTFDTSHFNMAPLNKF